MKKDKIEEGEHNKKALRIINNIMENKKRGLITICYVEGKNIKSTSLVRGSMKDLSDCIIALDKHIADRIEKQKKKQ